MDTRTERVVLETPNHRIIGDLVLPREGYRSRLSDFLNQGDITFVPLTDARIVPNGRGAAGEAEEVARRFVAVARDHVTIAYPEVDAGG